MTARDSYDVGRTGPRDNRLGGPLAARMALLLSALLLLSACAGKTPTGGLVVIITTSGLPVGEDFDAIEAVVKQETSPGVWHELFDVAQYVPQPIALPTTLAIRPGTGPDQDALIEVTALRNGVPVVQRVIQTPVPTDRVAEVLIVLAADCLGKVTLCPPGQSCQPDTGMCGSNVIDPSTLPTWVPGDEYRLDAGRLADASLGVDARGMDEAEATDLGARSFDGTEADDVTETGLSSFDGTEADDVTETGLSTADAPFDAMADATVSEGDANAGGPDGAADASSASSVDGTDATAPEGVDAPSDAPSADPCRGSCGPHQACAATKDAAACTCTVDPTCAAPGDVCTSSTSLVECVKDDQGCTYAFSTSTCSACPHGCLVTMVSVAPTGDGVPAMALGPSALYFLNLGVSDQTVVSLPLHGGPATTLAQAVYPNEIAVDSTSVYWGDQTDPNNLVPRIMKMPIDGGPPVVLETGSSPGSIAIYSTNVYWTTETDSADSGSVVKMPVDGGAPAVIAFGQYTPADLTVSATGLFWSNTYDPPPYTLPGTGSVVTVPLDGGAPTTLVSAPDTFLAGPVVDTTSIYWATQSGTGDPPIGTVMRMPLGGGTATTLASLSMYMNAIAVDDTGVYWIGRVSSGGAVLEVPLTHGAPGALITLASGLENPQLVVVDSSAVYFYDDGALAIMKVTK